MKLRVRGTLTFVDQWTEEAGRDVGRSRNTPPPTRQVRVTACRVPYDFSGAGH